MLTFAGEEIRWLPRAPDGHFYGYLPPMAARNMDVTVWVMLAVGSRAVHRLDRLVEARSDYAYVMSATRETIRVDGRATCPHCGTAYYDHTPIKVEGFDSFYKGCDGSILKT